MIGAILVIGILTGGIPDIIPEKDSSLDTVIRSWHAWELVSKHRALNGYEELRPGTIRRLFWTIHLNDAIQRNGYNRGRLVIPPELVTAIALRESRLNPSAVLLGCPRRGKRPKWCNSDGYPDIGLCQLHLNPAWSDMTRNQALDPKHNLSECVTQLKQHYRAHRGGGCTRQGVSGNWTMPWRGPFS
jgi:hypothetical protein